MVPVAGTIIELASIYYVMICQSAHILQTMFCRLRFPANIVKLFKVSVSIVLAKCPTVANYVYMGGCEGVFLCVFI